MLMRTGFAADIHPLEKGRPMVLGGVTIPYDYGFKGHSDADVLLHAICDALLGAICKEDIGHHFPNDDDTYKGIDSTELLAQVAVLVREAGYEIGNIDAFVFLEKPKIKPFVSQMRTKIAQVLGIEVGNVSIKSSTAEKLGFVGEEQGCIAYSSVLLTPSSVVKIKNSSPFSLPSYATEGSSGIDLQANLKDSITLKPLERSLIPTGIYVEIPPHMEGQIRPRSGNAIHLGMTCLNAPGTIDSDYRGEIKIIIINLSNQNVEILHGQKIAQMVFQHIEKVNFYETQQFSKTERNTKGFGHTGQ